MQRVNRVEQRAPGGGEETDEALVRALAAGDRGAMAALYERYAALLLALGRRMLRDGTSAEDLLHDVFLEAWRSAGSYDPGRGTVRCWLSLRMRSRALDRLRAAQQPLLPPPPTTTGQGEDPSSGPDRAVVRRALGALPAEQRALLELGYFEGLSSSEIAARLGIPTGTVKSRVAAAIARLAAGLRPPALPAS